MAFGAGMSDLLCACGVMHTLVMRWGYLYRFASFRIISPSYRNSAGQQKNKNKWLAIFDTA